MLLREEISDATLQLGKAGHFHFLADQENEIERLQFQIGETDCVRERRADRFHAAANFGWIA